MKIKFCVILTFVFFGVQSSVAQTVIQGTGPSGGFELGDITFGGKAGLIFSNWLGKDLSGVSPKVGLSLGGILEVPVTDNFYVQPEVLFSLLGSDIGNENINLVYAQIPVMAKYHITEEIAVELGPQVGFLLANNWDSELQGQDLNSIEMGMNVGGGYRMDENFYFQLRIGLGLTEILELPKAYNGSVMIGAAYFLD